MKNEAAFSGVLCRTLRDYGCKVQRIESGGTGLGIPDAFVRTFHTDVWIEMKNLVFPVTYSVRVPFRPGQYAWLKDYERMGGHSVLAIASQEGFFFFHNEHIHKEYAAPLSARADLSLTRLSGRAIVEWLDSL